MKTFLFILILTGFAVYLAGAAWYYIDKKKGGRRKAPMLLRAAGALLMATYFILVIITSRRSDRTAATRLEEYVPALDLRNPAGTLDIYDYL